MISNETDHPEMEEEPKELTEKVLDYDFNTDEIIEIEQASKPDKVSKDKNVLYSIINILVFCLDKTVNDYMEKFCSNNHSLDGIHHNSCKIWAKTEFNFERLMMTTNKKNYASLVTVQEGNLIPEDEQLDVKGIQILTKSVTPLSTRKALKKILLEDILKADKIDQIKFIKDIAILEKNIVKAVKEGSKEFYKPVTVKSIDAYEDPMKIQGVKASIAWNMIKQSDEPGIDINERNAVSVVKVNIDKTTIDDIKETFPNVYENMIKALDDETFKTYAAHPDPKTGEKKLLKNRIEAIALPLDLPLPDWMVPFIDYNSIIADNLNGFPYESIGLKRSHKNIGYTNIIDL